MSGANPLVISEAKISVEATPLETQRAAQSVDRIGLLGARRKCLCNQFPASAGAHSRSGWKSSALLWHARMHLGTDLRIPGRRPGRNRSDHRNRERSRGRADGVASRGGCCGSDTRRSRCRYRHRSSHGVLGGSRTIRRSRSRRRTSTFTSTPSITPSGWQPTAPTRPSPTQGDPSEIPPARATPGSIPARAGKPLLL